MKYYLAIDLGASSGRHIVGHEENGEIILDEVYRFPTGMDSTEDGLIWDIDRLYKEIKNGIKKALEKYKNIESLSIDTWAVDYVLLNENKEIWPCFAYRNDRTLKRIDEVHNIIPFKELYKKTGIQFATFNTIYQLYDDLRRGRLETATDFLMLPQYFAYLLTGVKKHEYTDASSTGMVNINTKQYDVDIIRKLNLPINIFKECETPGTLIGVLKDDVAQEVGGQIKVILAPSHDTACAFESIETDKETAFLSSGTWSLLGYRLKEAQTNDLAMKANFTNEGGVGYIRFLKNIMGMWIPNQLQKSCQVSYQEMAKQAMTSNYKEIFDVNDSSLASPEDMKTAVLALLKDKPPLEDKDIFNSVYLSLAHSYDKAVKELEECLGIDIKSICIVGGGANNKYLNELTKQITKKKIIAMPIEATAIGNIKTQIKVSK